MELKHASITYLIAKAKSYLELQSYSEGSITKYSRYWGSLEKECAKMNITSFDYEKCLEVMKHYWKISDLHSITPNQKFQLRTLECLRNLSEFGSFTKYHTIIRQNKNERYTEICERFCCSEQNKGISLNTIKSNYSIIKRFLTFIYYEKHTNVEQLTETDVKEYLNNLNESAFSPATKASHISMIRKFLTFLKEEQLANIRLQYLLESPLFFKYKKLPSHYTEEEIKRILKSVNRNTTLGKRDYLILLLGIQLGIRVSDIRNLKLENICISSKTLEFYQQKTGNFVRLPLNESVLLAIADYIKYARHCTADYTNLFLKSYAPYTPYSKSNAFHYVLVKYMKMADIDYSARKHGLHSMRHSLAGNLLGRGIPLPTISSILGHSTTVTTMEYIKIDFNQLKGIALEVPYER